MTINEWIREIHANAKEHGWWEEPRTIGEVCALVNSEWSEALEEYRSGNPARYYNKKPSCDACFADNEDVPECIFEICPDGFKPEGMAVELADGVIRILDFFGERGYDLGDLTMIQVADEAGEEMAGVEDSFGDIIANLQYATSMAARWYDKKSGEVNETDDDERIAMWLMSAATMAYMEIKTLGCDPEEIIKEKHQYNKARPYRHGGKRL
jgi:hypothetical protein